MKYYIIVPAVNDYHKDEEEEEAIKHRTDKLSMGNHCP
jgi:hypothetical protein